jgi:hypothetical protein
MRGAVATFAVAMLGLAACGGNSTAPANSPPPVTTPPPAGSFGDYAADTTLDEDATVRAYVDAIDRRDGQRFCSVVASWISGRFDLYGKDPDASLASPADCPRLVRGFIGYIEDCCPPKFVGVEVDDVGPIDRRGDLTRVDIDVTLHLKAAPNYRAAETEPLHDVVWLVRERGAWRVAKLSATAAAASLVGGDESLLAEPDPQADARRFVAERNAFEHRAVARERSFRSVGSLADCSGSLVMRDDPGDPVDYRFPHPATPVPAVARADLRGVRIRSGDGEVCVRFDLAGDARAPMTFTLLLSGVAATGTSFARLFDVELRGDGKARVTSGERAGHAVAVPARVGRGDRAFSLLLDDSSFDAGVPLPSSRGPLNLERFVFVASVTVPISSRRTLHDDLGPQRPSERFIYPSGEICPTAC